jgi:hypothetical protein
MGAKASRPPSEFKVPSAAQISDALGLAAVMNAVDKKTPIFPNAAIGCLDVSSWPALPPPAPDGWLNVVHETGQTYSQFLIHHQSMDRSVLRSPYRERWNTIAVISADPNPAPGSITKPASNSLAAVAPDMQILASYFRAFFGPLKVEVLPALTAVERTELDAGRTVCAGTGNLHYSTKHITDCVRAARKQDCFAALLVATQDEMYRGDDKTEWEIGQVSASNPFCRLWVILIAVVIM